VCACGRWTKNEESILNYSLFNGSNAYAALNRSIIESAGVRQLFVGWINDASVNNLVSDPILMNGPKNADAIWKTQFWVTFNQNGLHNDYDITILVDSVDQKLPISVWVDDGAKIVFLYPEHLQNGFGVYYCLEEEMSQSMVVHSPITFSARYLIEYNAWQFILLLTLVILLLLGVFGLIWKRRGKTNLQ
jgi:hypothetical protein